MLDICLLSILDIDCPVLEMVVSCFSDLISLNFIHLLVSFIHSLCKYIKCLPCGNLCWTLESPRYVRVLQEFLSIRKGMDTFIVITHINIMEFKVDVCRMLWEHRRSLDTDFGVEGDYKIKEGFLERFGSEDCRILEDCISRRNSKRISIKTQIIRHVWAT